MPIWFTVGAQTWLRFVCMLKRWLCVFFFFLINNFKKYLFIWLHRVLVVAHRSSLRHVGSFTLAHGLSSCCLQALWPCSRSYSWTRDGNLIPCVARQILNHWTLGKTRGWGVETIIMPLAFHAGCTGEIRYRKRGHQPGGWGGECLNLWLNLLSSLALKEIYWKKYENLLEGNREVQLLSRRWVVVRLSLCLSLPGVLCFSQISWSFFRQAFSVRVLASAPRFAWGFGCHETLSDLNPHYML